MSKLLGREDMSALEPVLWDATVRQMADRVASGELSGTVNVFEAMGVTEGATKRAVRVFAECVERPSEEAVFPFAVAFSWGEAEAMRRVSMALSDPRARSREREVVAGLTSGLDIEEALQQAARPEPEAGVVQFRR
ncbi:hypothetical protein V5F38_12190 [Xanthobacter sp. V0B-10]|uniref:hypothetical protein n=1 Tax=Xanthobacter albus TaxID=3119929 RepID=UPI00372AF5DF